MSDIVCTECGRRFPLVDGIACLLPDPHAELDEWRARADEFLRDNAETRDRLLAQVAGTAVHALTRKRMDALRCDLEAHASRLRALVEAAGLSPRPRGRVDRDRVPGEGTLTAYYHQIHRDWGWDGQEADEVAAALGAIDGVLPADASLGAMLVLGAGACRVPWELHRRRCHTTIALDINPLPMLVARRLLAGESVRLLEFPVRPRTTDTVSVDRELVARGAPASGFHLVFGDGLDPPVRPGAFDTVFTPWFIDQIPRDLTTLLPVIAEALRPGGRFIDTGPLIYHPAHTELVHRYCVDEVLALVEEAGFAIERYRFERMPYMVSPACSQGRTEMVLTLAAIRSPSAPTVRPARSEPAPVPWLADPQQPVPRVPGLADYRAPHPMFATIVALVDGRRTVADIAAVLVSRHRVPEAAAVAGVQAALAEVLRSIGHAQRGGASQ